MSAARRPIPARAARGFTLIEALAVVTVIVILVGLLLAVGVRVVSGQQAQATRGVLLTLDRALEEYFAVRDGFPTLRFEDPESDFLGRPDIDNTLLAYEDRFGAPLAQPARPDASPFLAAAAGQGECDAILAGIPDRFLVTTPTNNDRDTTPSVLDAWAEDTWPRDPRDLDDPPRFAYPVATQQLVYYVTPENELAQDLYGRCVNGRPYFMSAGADRAYGLGGGDDNLDQDARYSSEDATTYKDRVEGALDDNLYSYEVGPADRSAAFFNAVRDTRVTPEP